MQGNENIVFNSTQNDLLLFFIAVMENATEGSCHPLGQYPRLRSTCSTLRNRRCLQSRLQGNIVDERRSCG